MASGQTLAYWDASACTSKAADNFCFPGLQTNNYYLAFPDAVLNTCYFSSVIPSIYDDGGIELAIYWSPLSSSGNVVWNGAVERHQEDVHDLDSNGFASNQSVTSAATSANTMRVSSISFSAAEADSVTADEHFQLRIQRDGANASDTMTAIAYLMRVELSES